jgi:hypothetical protein
MVLTVNEGKSISKKPPYGYLRDEDLKLYPDPETSWVVRYIYEKFCEDQGRQQIAQDLDKMGIAPPFKGRNNCPHQLLLQLSKLRYI